MSWSRMHNAMDPELETWRDRTLRNNLSWLESFGCSLHRKHGLLHVTHCDLEYYNAWLVYSGSEEARESIAALLADPELGSQFRDLYVDDLAYSESLGEWLADHGLVVAGTTTTMGSVWDGVRRPSRWRVTPSEDLEQWSAIYSTGFQLSASEAAIEERRWRRAEDATDSLRFWYIRNHEIVGVCQTYEHSGVTGLFSMTLLPVARGRSDLAAIGRTVFSAAGVPPSSVVYYERPRSATRCQSRYSPPRAGRFTPLRSMFWYRRPGNAVDPD